MPRLGIRDAVMEAASATLHAANDMGLDAKAQKNLAAKSAAIAASSGTQDLHLPVGKCAQQAAWAAQQAVAKLGFDVDRQAVAAVSAASSFMVSALRRKGKAPVEQAVEAATSAKAAAAGAAQNTTRQIRIAIDVATAVAADGMRQLGRSSSQQAQAAADAVRQVAEIVGLSPAEQQLEAEKAAAQVKSLVGDTGKRAEVAVHPWQALGSSPPREPSLLPNQAQILGAGPATEKSFMPECAQAGVAYDDIDHPTLNGGVVDNAEHCQVSCSLNWFCESFTFFPNTKQCWLLGIKGTPRPDLDAISGPQVCGTRMEAATDIPQDIHGVHWSHARGKYHSSVYFNNIMHHVGYFGCELEAAKAYDARLRSLCEDGVRLKKSLNFPTAQEASFETCQLKSREHALRIHQNKLRTEEESFRTLSLLFQQSAQASCYEIVRIGGFARADALFRLVGCGAGIRLQIKSSAARGPSRQSYQFSNTKGYQGMLVILVAPDIKACWVVAGDRIKQHSIEIVLGSGRDRAWRAREIGATLASCLRNEAGFPHTSLREARLQCSTNHQVEQWAHLQLAELLSVLNFRLQQSSEAGAVADSVLKGEGCRWRVQEKAANFHKTKGTYTINLRKQRGKHCYVGYEEGDFDLLVAAVLDAGRLSGLFIFPVRVLVGHGFVGQKSACLPLHPPWALPKRQETKAKYAWQLEYFVDLRSWSEQLSLADDNRMRLRQLLSKLSAAAQAITKSALDAAEKSFASGGGVDPKIALNRAATAARDTASSSQLPEDRRWEEVAHAVGAAAAWIDKHNGASVDKQVSAAAKAAKSVAESHGMTVEMQLQLAVEAASAAAAQAAGDDEKARTEAVIKAAKDTAAAMGVSAEEQTDLAVEAAARIAGLAAKEAGKTRKEQLEAVAAAADAAAQSLGLPTPRAKEVAATATSSAYIASKDISTLDPVQLAIKTLGFDPETVPQCSIVNTAFNDENHPVNGGYVASANQCQETCQTVWYCESFTYNVTSKACHLLGDSATASPSQHVVSGPVKCGQRLLLKFVSIHDAMRSMSNSALQAAQEARLAGKGLTAQLHAAKTTVESFTAEADFSRSDQVQMASVAVAECAARVAKEAGLDTERQLHAASHAARKAAQEAGMTDQEQWQQVTTAAAATALFLKDTPMTRDQRSREARLAAEKVSLVSPFAPEVQVAQSAKAVQIAMAFTGSQTSDLPVLASQAARLSAAAVHLPEASQTALADQAKQQALDIQKHFEAMVDRSVTVKKDVLPGLGGIAKVQGDEVLGSLPSRFDVRMAEKVQDASEFGELHDVISHAIDGTTAAELSAATAAKVEIAAKDEPLGSQSGMLRESGGPSTEQKRSFMWCTALVVVGVLVFAGVVFMVMEAGKGKKRSRKKVRRTRSGTPTPMASFDDSDSDLLLYADEAPHPGEPARGTKGCRLGTAILG
ncbi:unnamed protein product [Symbiodinium sp. CCMP2592]|nr:unnamed protein product [Symbiodinium sp. CCMP2592]